ncbi:HAD-IIIA family hydrolase [Kitasatospora sp. NPDC001309]|uniref:HAD-IIIA family hydrolase n=2 Tax=unclassified Kitasatospora TaxID=2633591 RepID=UPI003697E3F7
MTYLGETVPTVPQPRSAGDRPDGADGTGPWLYSRSGPSGADGPTGAVLFGRDGTLLQDVSCNGDPALVLPMAGVRGALTALRGAGLAIGVLTNQPGVARGLIGRAEVEAVQARAELLLGPFDVWAVCPHGRHDGCSCHMPSPALVSASCRALGLPPARVTVIGSGDAVIAAALDAGARAIRVPEAAARITVPCPPCTLTVCRAAAGPVQAADLLLHR